jgi:hypothetical protein
MNQQQRRYTQKRMDQMFEQVESKLRDKHTAESVKLERKDLYEQIKKGTAKLKPKAEALSRGWSNPSVRDFFRFTGETDGGFDADAYNKEIVKYRKALDKAKDEVMLGDSATAMKLLADFTTLCEGVK